MGRPRGPSTAAAQQVPLRHLEGLLPPGFEVSSAVECRNIRQWCRQILIAGYGLWSRLGGRTAI